MTKLRLNVLGAAVLLAALSLPGAPHVVGSAEALTLSQQQSIQRWCGPGGRLCYDPTTTRWTWKKRRR